MNTGKSPGEGESLDREKLVCVGPSPRRHPANATRERSKGLDAVLVAVLGMNGFTRTEVDGLAGHLHLLALQTREMHFDAMTLAIVEAVMLERIEPECAAKLAIDTCQE